MKTGVSTSRRIAVGGMMIMAACASPALADDSTLEELRLLKARIKQLEERVSTQDKQQTASRVSIQTKQRAMETKIKQIARTPAPSFAPIAPAPVHVAEHKEKHWYEKLSLRGYTQARMNGLIDTDGPRAEARLPGDRSFGINNNFFLRRVRLIVSGDVSDHLYLYLQPDFASSLSGVQASGSSSAVAYNFAQLRDAYADIYFDSKKEHRVRAGQSKIPYSFENLQSSQNRLSLDRNDALNSCCRDERDIGLFYYYTPEHLRPVFRDLVKNNLKGSGDYGMFAFGAHNGQGASRPEINNELHFVSRFTYPYTFANGQIFEAGAQGYVGRYVVPSTTTGGAGVTPTIRTDRFGYRDQRVGVHAILYPQPFGLQAEWNWGRGPSLNAAQTAIETRSLEGGYVQAFYKYDDKLLHTGVYFPFVKYQVYRGGQKTETNTPYNKVNDLEIGVEWQPRPELEFTATYAKLNRTNVLVAPYRQFKADAVRGQLQWNY